MSARLVFATSNAHKVSELEAILAPAWEGFEAGCVARMSDFDVASPVEDGVTFEENSLIKARALARATGLAAIADDSGICAVPPQHAAYVLKKCQEILPDEEVMRELIERDASIAEIKKLFRKRYTDDDNPNTQK